MLLLPLYDNNETTACCSILHHFVSSTMTAISLCTLLLLALLPSSCVGGSWIDVIQSYLTNTTTIAPQPSSPPSPPAELDKYFRLADAAWDTSEAEVSMEIIQRLIGCPIAHEFGISAQNPFGYDRIPTEDNEWGPMYQAYHAIVPAEQATIPLHYQANAFVLPIDIQYSPDTGRGIVATTFIPKGTMVWRPRNAAEFTSKEQVRGFLEHILAHAQKEVACDAIRWLYSMKASPREDDYVLCVDFDEGSMINRAETLGEVNVEAVFHKIDDNEEDRTVYGCQQGELYTTKDIHPGEELLMDYAEFAEGEGFWVHGIDPTGL